MTTNHLSYIPICYADKSKYSRQKRTPSGGDKFNLKQITGIQLQRQSNHLSVFL